MIFDTTNIPLDLSIDRIHSEEEYNAALARIEELLPLTWNEELQMDDPNMQELIRLGNIVADWEDENVVIE